MARRLAWAIAMTLFALAGMAPAYPYHGRTQGVNRESAGWPLAAFALVDHEGRAFTQRRLAGRWTFVLFGDTRCAAPCDTALAALAAMQQRISNAEAIRTTQVLFVSLDPEHDTPERLRRYVAAFDARFIAATGARDALHRLMDELDVAQPGALVLIGPDAVLRGELLPPYDPLLLTSEYMRTRSRR
jgi:protein SCO1/2